MSLARWLKYSGGGMRRGSMATAVALAALMGSTITAGDAVLQDPAGVTFRGGIDLVTVSAVVRDRKGRLVSTLTSGDFQVIDAGQQRPITQFRAEQTPISVALLFDISGSMDVAFKLGQAREAAHHILSWLWPGKDEVALYAFDTALEVLAPFSNSPDDVRQALERVKPFGATSLRDAIAATAQRVVERGRLRRAVVVITDGVDTASRLSAGEVSAIASAIDVPVYILAVVSPLDHPGAPSAVGDAEKSEIAGSLTELAQWTGGELMVASVPAHASKAAQQIVSELRHQYLIAFEPSGKAGWHPLEIKARDKDLIVRARSGYVAGQRPVSSR